MGKKKKNPFILPPSHIPVLHFLYLPTQNQDPRSSSTPGEKTNQQTGHVRGPRRKLWDGPETRAAAEGVTTVNCQSTNQVASGSQKLLGPGSFLVAVHGWEGNTIPGAKERVGAVRPGPQQSKWSWSWPFISSGLYLLLLLIPTSSKDPASGFSFS